MRGTGVMGGVVGAEHMQYFLGRAKGAALGVTASQKGVACANNASLSVRADADADFKRGLGPPERSGLIRGPLP